jgi:hypothetical protein
MCVCEEDGITHCEQFFCRDGSCPGGTSPVEGTLICAIDDGLLKGDCRSSPPCPEGYERVGDLYCVKVDDGQ